MNAGESLSRCRVLVVDDNHDLADNVAELLQQLECTVDTAYGVEPALSALMQRQYDLAIVDIRMARGGGLTVLSAVKRTCTEAEVILMTANASVDTAIQAVVEGAFAYLEKPFDSQQLLSLCERALSQVRLRAERIQLQHDLARSEALYREVVDTVAALIFGIDQDGIIRMCNAAAALALDVPRGELSGRPSASFMASESGAQIFEDALRIARSGGRTSDLELPLISASGAERIVRFTLSQMDLGRSYDIMVLAVGVDMTDRIELEKRASEAQAMASLATLTAGLAHEVRNPLNAASLQLQLLNRQASKLHDPELRARMLQRVGIVDLELSRLTKLLDDFLKLARPQRLAMSPVHVADLLREVRALHGPAARERAVQLEVAIADDDLVALGDANMLKQVLVNLVNNALDAVEGEGVVLMRCTAQGRSRVALEVIDSGPGIPEDMRGRLFVPFATTKEAGTGLGLTLVKRIVDRHGGTVSIHSSNEAGTTVRVVLPRCLRSQEGREPGVSQGEP